MPLLLSGMPAGTRVGTLIHSVMESTDFATPDLARELRTALGSALSWQQFDLGDLDGVVAGLVAAIETPLGPMVEGLRFRDVGRADRVDELSFELPLVGGDRPLGDLSVADIAWFLAAHLPSDDALAGYAARLIDPSLDRVLPRLSDRQPRPGAAHCPATGSSSSTTRRTGSG